MNGRHVVTACACAWILAGCVVTSPPMPTRGVVVNSPPPVALAEERTPSPSSSAVWVDGYWHWTGAQYAWVPGHWESAPPGSKWAGPQYTQREGSYVYEPGGWQPTDNTGKRAIR